MTILGGEAAARLNAMRLDTSGVDRSGIDPAQQNARVSETVLSLAALTVPHPNPSIGLAPLLRRWLLLRLLEQLEEIDATGQRNIVIALCKELAECRVEEFSELIEGHTWPLLDQFIRVVRDPSVGNSASAYAYKLGIGALAHLSARPLKAASLVLAGDGIDVGHVNARNVGMSGRGFAFRSSDCWELHAAMGSVVLRRGPIKSRWTPDGHSGPQMIFAQAPGLDYERPPSWRDVPTVGRKHGSEVFNRSLDFLGDLWPAGAAEVRFFCRYLTPLRLMPDRVWRNSSQSDIGYHIITTLSATSIPESCEALIHETMHLKLGMLERLLGPLVHGDRADYRHAWRPDQRPLQGVFLAAHAVSQVLEMYERLAHREGSAVTSFVDIRTLRQNVKDAITTLCNSGELTQLGAAVLETFAPRGHLR